MPLSSDSNALMVQSVLLYCPALMLAVAYIDVCPISRDAFSVLRGHIFDFIPVFALHPAVAVVVILRAGPNLKDVAIPRSRMLQSVR